MPAIAASTSETAAATSPYHARSITRERAREVGEKSASEAPNRMKMRDGLYDHTSDYPPPSKKRTTCERRGSEGRTGISHPHA